MVNYDELLGFCPRTDSEAQHNKFHQILSHKQVEIFSVRANLAHQKHLFKTCPSLRNYLSKSVVDNGNNLVLSGKLQNLQTPGSLDSKQIGSTTGL